MIKMIGPYRAESGGAIRFVGNKLFGPIDNVRSVPVDNEEIERRVQSIHDNNYWSAIARINHTINRSVNDYFTELGAIFTPLPLTTRMISSPGAVYGKEAIDYTTDTCPITLRWFDLPEEAFLAESSQIYLELSLLQAGIDQVYANYSSFRKEEADATHLSEFHHIEYEGKVDQKRNIEIVNGMFGRIITDLLRYNEIDLAVFIDDKEMKELEDTFSRPIPIITLKEALALLREDTADDKYKGFTLEHFHSWEEVRLTEIVGGIIGVSEMPLLEVPFYHAMKDGSDPAVADCTDFILPGYRETVGSGHRVGSIEELETKANIFNLPREDYEPYLQSRRFSDYEETSGFGLGLERLLQGILHMPFIYSVNQFPRVDTTLRP